VLCSRQLIGSAVEFLSHWHSYTVISLERVAYSSYCNTVEWFWWDWSLFQWPTGFLQCFDAIDWVIWLVQIVPGMTYKVSSGTLSLYSLTHSWLKLEPVTSCPWSQIRCSTKWDAPPFNIRWTGIIRIRIVCHVCCLLFAVCAQPDIIEKVIKQQKTVADQTVYRFDSAATAAPRVGILCLPGYRVFKRVCSQSLSRNTNWNTNRVDNKNHD